MLDVMRMRGIVTVLNTPFTDDDKLDLDGLRRNVDDALAAGVAGFLVPAMASEVSKLTEGERTALVEAVARRVNGRVPVIGGASAPDSATRVRMTRVARDAGCDGVLVSIPFVNEAGYERAVREVAELDPGFLMIQDWDSAGYGLPVSLIKRLFHEVEAFRCLKIEVVPAGVKYSEVLEATDGRLHVSGGWAVTQMIEGLDRGVHAFMPTGMHAIYTRICSLYASGRRDDARALFDRISPVLAFSNQHLDISIHFFKRLLHAQGTYSTPNVRPPILPFDSVHERISRELISRVVRVEQELRGGLFA